MRFLIAVALLWPAAAQDYSVGVLTKRPLTNEAVVTLAKAGFDDLFLMRLIAGSRTNFDVSIPAMVALKQAGLSEEVIRFMVIPEQRVLPKPVVEEAPAKAPPHKHWLPRLPWQRTTSPQPPVPPQFAAPVAPAMKIG
jgi:hypothetical protein